MIDKQVQHYNDGSIKSIQYKKDNKYHREGGPAYISYYNNDNIQSKIYFNYEGWDCTREVDEWMVNKFNKWQDMSESDFNRMWMEIL